MKDQQVGMRKGLMDWDSKNVDVENDSPFEKEDKFNICEVFLEHL